MPTLDYFTPSPIDGRCNTPYKPSIDSNTIVLSGAIAPSWPSRSLLLLRYLIPPSFPPSFLSFSSSPPSNQYLFPNQQPASHPSFYLPFRIPCDFSASPSSRLLQP